MPDVHKREDEVSPLKRLAITQLWLLLLLAPALPAWPVPPQPGLPIVIQPGPTTSSVTLEDGKAYRIDWRQQGNFRNVTINLEIAGAYRAYLILEGRPQRVLATKDGPPAAGKPLFQMSELKAGFYSVVVVRRATTPPTDAATWSTSRAHTLAGSSIVAAGLLNSGTPTSPDKPYEAAFTFLALPDNARPRFAVTTQWTHDPAVAYGPDSWGLAGPPAETCGFKNPFGTFRFGRAQSPIDIAAAASQYDGLRALSFNYPATGLPYVIENIGTTIEVPGDADFHLTYNNDRYTLEQFHVHAPSEHTLDGKSYELEVHLVHENALGQLAVVAVLLDGTGSATRTGIDTMIEGAPASVGEEKKADSTIKVDFVPQSGNFYFYSGSLTSPPCTEGVLWIVSADKTQTITTATLTALHELIKKFPSYNNYANNNRPVVTGQNHAAVFRRNQ